MGTSAAISVPAHQQAIVTNHFICLFGLTAGNGSPSQADLHIYGHLAEHALIPIGNHHAQGAAAGGNTVILPPHAHLPAPAVQIAAAFRGSPFSSLTLMELK